jgi:uncharacterized protein YuzE
MANKVKVSIDRETGMMYIRLPNKNYSKKVITKKTNSKRVLVDISPEGEICGIEVFPDYKKVNSLIDK